MYLYQSQPSSLTKVQLIFKMPLPMQLLRNWGILHRVFQNGMKEPVVYRHKNRRRHLKLLKWETRDEPYVTTTMMTMYLPLQYVESKKSQIQIKITKENISIPTPPLNTATRRLCLDNNSGYHDWDVSGTLRILDVSESIPGTLKSSVLFLSSSRQMMRYCLAYVYIFHN
jgi:hypothetical protein